MLYVVYRFHPPSKGKNILVVCGPGNNGPVVLALFPSIEERKVLTTEQEAMG